MAVTGEDEKVLEAIFNPNLPSSTSNQVVSEQNKFTEDDQIDPVIMNQVKELEIEGVNAAELGNFDESLQIFNNAINLAPMYAASYNNRAQLNRMKGNTEAARQDLDKAVELSKGKGKTAAQAFTQRALLKKLEGDSEGCFEDFQKAADLGNMFAKSQVVQMNPYAALCNQMLSEAFTKLKEGKHVG